jgi:DNA polymerase-3 subunit epsilon
MAMTRGQDSLMISMDQPQTMLVVEPKAQFNQAGIVKLANSTELEAHAAYLAALDKTGDCLWAALESTTIEK